jgi:hypothetical protein
MPRILAAGVLMLPVTAEEFLLSQVSLVFTLLGEFFAFLQFGRALRQVLTVYTRRSRTSQPRWQMQWVKDKWKSTDNPQGSKKMPAEHLLNTEWRCRGVSLIIQLQTMARKVSDR